MEWNGVTTLEWAILALEAADAHWRGEPVVPLTQPGTEVVTKYELLCTFRDVLAPGRRVAKVAGEEAIDRSLVPSDLRSPIREQLQRLAAWYPVAP